jgi:hypothetical protein
MELPPPPSRKTMTPEQIRALRGSLKGRGMLEALLGERQRDRELEEAKIARWLASKKGRPPQ